MTRNNEGAARFPGSRTAVTQKMTEEASVKKKNTTPPVKVNVSTQEVGVPLRDPCHAQQCSPFSRGGSKYTTSA